MQKGGDGKMLVHTHRPVATGGIWGQFPQISFVLPQILLRPEKFVLNI